MKDRFLRACRCEPTDTTPVWFLRQNGRYLPLYRELRAKHSLLALCSTPELAARLTVEPTHRLDIDAALLFSDVAWPLVPMGLPFEAVKPDASASTAGPVRSAEDIQRLRPYDAACELRPLLDGIALAKTELPHGMPLVGVAAAPFTMACYALEGGAPDFSRVRALLRTDEALWARLADTLASVVVAVVEAQVAAGVDALVVFDSWADALDAETYRRSVAPYTEHVCQAARAEGVPVIHFAPVAADLLPDIAAVEADIVGVDWRVPLDEAWTLLGSHQGIMGNLDPTVLLGPVERMLGATADVLERARRRPGHIFNLGHGLLPSTPLDRVQALARYVHAYRAG